MPSRGIRGNLLERLLPRVDRDTIHPVVEEGERHHNTLRKNERRSASAKVLGAIVERTSLSKDPPGKRHSNQLRTYENERKTQEFLTFSVDDHLVDPLGLGGLDGLGIHLGDLGDVLNVGTVRPGSEDGSTETVSSFVRAGHEGTASVVDERGALDVDVLAVEGILEKLDDILSDGVLALESLGSTDG